MMNALKIHVQGQAGNPALVFLHAFPFSAEMWEQQLSQFSEKFYCIAPDLPGFGKSPQPEHAFTFEYFVDAVLDELKRVKIEKAIFCGLSMGGYVALRLYERAPEQVRALILCDTKAGADTNDAKLKRWSAIQNLQKNRSEFVEAQWQALIGEHSKSNTALKSRFNELITRTSDQGIASGLVALATRTDTTEKLPQIRVPTLVVVGEEDKVTPVNDAQILAKSIASSQVRVLNQTGHLSNLENPREFNAVLTAFLDSLK